MNVLGVEGRLVRKVQMVTDRELEILKVLWVRGKASVREVQQDLNKFAGPVAYSTVQTLLNIMEDKKSLVRHVVEGRTFIYIPRKTSERTIRELTGRFVDRVAPILEGHCLRCHQGANRGGDLDLSTASGLKEGEAVVPGKPEESRLFRAISGEKPGMPRGGDRPSRRSRGAGHGRRSMRSSWPASGPEGSPRRPRPTAGP